MNTNLTTTNQNSKLALTKARNLMSMTKKILTKKDIDSLVQNFLYKPYFSDGHTSEVRKVCINPDGKYI